MSRELALLAADYRRRFSVDASTLRAELHESARSLSARRLVGIADAASVAIAVDGLLKDESFHVDSLSPEATEAFHKAYPHVDLNSLDGADKEAVLDYANAWKGKLFELTVRDELNAGRQVGDWQLEPGQVAELADSPTQPGWDLLIRDPDGHVASTVQLKATESASYVHEAIDRYPDISIITTDDVAPALDGVDHVSSADISTSDLEHQIHLDDHSAGMADIADGVHLAMPATLIVATEVLSVATGSKTVGEAVESAGERAVDAAISMAIGGAVGALTFGIAGVAVGLLTRLSLSSRRQKAKLASRPSGGMNRGRGLLQLPDKRLPIRNPEVIKITRGEFNRSLRYLGQRYSPQS